MAAYVSHELLKRCRKSDLYEFLKDRYPQEIQFTESGLQMMICDTYPAWVGKGFSGFVYYEGMERKTGNAIDFLTEFLDMTIPQAVEALTPYIKQEVNNGIK